MLYRFDTIGYTLGYTHLSQRCLLLALCMAAMEKGVGKIVKRFFVVRVHYLPG
ncbi:hypothetical protein ADICEAN_04220 [Cesiribacter andamanensis AMV16]|uniref:Uncharacterized protein n=1 Tax=Cesiribacter andamanensis AMV16 TaxID=1279009 RepID=M7NFR2_9BACT|nr:hypothetical protein ADICEAN_04220 [Cesiribacter andamanensis AMV16]